MNIVVLNGSPKGDISVTMQYIAYIRKKFPDNSYEIFNVAQDVRKIEKDSAVLDSIIGSIHSADAILWAFPLYFMVVSSQYKRFIEIIFERGLQDAFSGKYVAALSTSIHFFDQTAHAYIHAISDDLGMRYLGFYSAEMMDLLKEEERKRLEKFVSLLFSAVSEEIPVQLENPPLVWPCLLYIPETEQQSIAPGTKKVVILTDDDGSSPNLAAMTSRLEKAFSCSAERINLHDLDIRGGCLGCCQCGHDNTCVYTDGYVDFFKSRLLPADIIIIAGSVHDRYLSSTWKQFFDRSFFKGHIPALKGKQIGFVIAGPLQQIPLLREVLVAWADIGGCRAQFVTDEVTGAAELDALIDAMAKRLLEGAESGYIPPPTFYAVGGHKIFRDGIYGDMRIAFQADYRYYADHGMFDFPQADRGNRAKNTLIILLMRIPGFRKRVFTDLKHHMVEAFGPVLREA